MPAPVGAAAAPHKFTLLAAGCTLLLIAELVRLVIFMSIGDPVRGSGWSVTPWNAFITRHACSTAYWVAATGVDRKPDVYSATNYQTGRDPVTGRSIDRQIGPYHIDPYQYPPTFLQLPRLLSLVMPDFFAFHRWWALLNIVVVVAGLVIVARRIDGQNASRSLWLVPLALMPLAIIATFQGGNAQLLFVVIAMLAMLAFERGHVPAGGLLLAFAVVGKLFPALLLVYLVVRRDWRAVAWTTAWAVVLVAVALVDVGWAPFAYFLDHLPRLMSGEAFPMLRVPGPPNMSLSAPGILLKLPAFGGPALPFVSLKIAGWIFTVVILWATIQLARRPVADRLAPLAWLAVLGLATLRSPFLPNYGMFQGVWIASIVLAVCWADRRRRAWALALWLVLLPTTAGPTPLPAWLIAGGTTLQTLAVLALIGLAIRVGREGAGTQAPGVASASA